MSIWELLPFMLAIFTTLGAIWYKLGKLTQVVKFHNLRLSEIQKMIERILIQRG